MVSWLKYCPAEENAMGFRMASGRELYFFSSK